MNYLTAMGRHEEATRTIARAYELDPLSLIIRAARGWARWFARDVDGGIAHLEDLIDREPDFSTGHLWIAFVYDMKGDFDRALAAATRGAELTARGPWSLTGMGRALAHMGRRTEAETILTELRDLASRRYVSPYDQALLCEALGQDDETLAQLERAHEVRANLMVLLAVDPRWDRIRPDPRFADLDRRMRFPATVRLARVPA
jgi:Flp pilus assembly protein TadD